MPDDTAWGPPDVLDLYSWPTDANTGKGKVIALIGGFHSPTVEADLAAFSNFYNLPSCTIKNGCLVQVDLYGRKTPVPDIGSIIWQTEAALDVQWVHAIAPAATILLVETWDLSYSNFTTAIQYGAARADVVSASWLFTENEQQLSFDHVLAGLSPYPLFAPTGDSGPGVFWPASSPSVVSVGGTVFDMADDMLLEECWVSSGGGCSAVEKSPSVQKNNHAWRNSDAPQLCGGFRSVPDCSSLAFPVWIYFSTLCASPPACWFKSGGTSVSAPLVAARSAVLDAHLTIESLYTSSDFDFADIVLGEADSQAYVNLSNPATVGYDLCTGLGSFLGLAATVSTTTRTSMSGTSATDVNSSGCFAADSLVRVRLPNSNEVVTRQLSDVRVHDEVECFDPHTLQRQFSPVYFVAHRTDKHAAQLIELAFLYPTQPRTHLAQAAGDEGLSTTVFGRKKGSLKLTPNHLLLSSARAEQQPELKPARDIKVGEYIFVVEPESNVLLPTRVHHIQETSGLVLNPLTLSDRIVVADVAASVFVESETFYRLLTLPLKLLAVAIPSQLNEDSWFSFVLDFVVLLTNIFESQFQPSFVSVALNPFSK